MAGRSARAALHPAVLSADARAVALALLARRCAAALRGKPRRAGRHDEARRSRVDGADRPLRHADMLREDGSLELYESEAEFRASLPGWAARDRFGIAFRHVEGEELAALQPGLSKQFVKGTFVPGWKTVERPEAARQGGLGLCRRQGARFERRRQLRVAVEAVGATVCDWLTARWRTAGRTPGRRRRRLVAPARRAARRHDPAGDRARLQHDAAAGRLRREAAAHLRRPRLRRHAAVDRPARRRRRRARRARPAAELSRARRPCSKRQALPARAADAKAAASGWAIARRCRTRCRSSAGRGTARTSSTPSATAISA